MAGSMFPKNNVAADHVVADAVREIKRRDLVEALGIASQDADDYTWKELLKIVEAQTKQLSAIKGIVL